MVGPVTPCGAQTPHAASGSGSQFFYSIEAGPVHSIVLSNYHNYTRGSEQARPVAAPIGQAHIVAQRLGLLLPGWHA